MIVTVTVCWGGPEGVTEAEPDGCVVAVPDGAADGVPVDGGVVGVLVGAVVLTPQPSPVAASA
ncbi:MAG: hypothetical protein ABIZ07_05850, partial [Dermatophilaceae bacterium]